MEWQIREEESKLKVLSDWEEEWRVEEKSSGESEASWQSKEE